MTVSVMRQETSAAAYFDVASGGASLCTFALAEGDREEVLAFLAARAVHTVYMASLIRDNGVVSLLNRGTFYGCADREGKLFGVALVGHATLVEVRCDAALEAFARLARACADAYLIRGEQDVIESFWKHYSDGGALPRRICREQLYELRLPAAAATVAEPVAKLRRATSQEMDEIMSINASMAVTECGENPLERDPEGFRARTARRVAQGRVWVWADARGIVFKADALAETPEAVYLEGVYVRPQERGKGVGLSGMAQLGRELLRRAEAICLVVNEKSAAAQAFYQKSGYRFCGSYDTIYLQPGGAKDALRAS